MKRIVSFALAGAFLVAGVCSASEKTCEILLAAPTQAGSVWLLPGQYRVTVEGSDVVFLEVRSVRSLRTPVKVEDGAVNYETTRVSTSKRAGAERMDAIEFEGSGTRIEFR